MRETPPACHDSRLAIGWRAACVIQLAYIGNSVERMNHEERQRAGRLAWWAPLCAVAVLMAIFAALYFDGREKQFAEQLTDARVQLRNQAVSLTRFNEALAIWSAPELKETSFGQGPPQSPRGKVLVDPKQGVVLIASNLPPTPAGKAYQMWILPKEGTPVPAGGLFPSELDGTALAVHRGAADWNAIQAVEVTIENEQGARQPTSAPVIMVPLR